MTQYILKAADKAALWAALADAGFAVDGENGPTVPGTFNEVGIVHAGTGNMLEQDGFEYEETAPVDGWFAVLMTDRDVSALADLIDASPPASVPRFAVREPTPAQIKAKERERADEIKAECKRRILAVASPETQMNIAQAGVIYSALRVDGMSALDAQAMAGFAAGDLHAASMWKAWVAAMQRHCGELIRREHDDEPWPALPDGVADLAGRF